MNVNKILVAVDYSDCSKRAVEYATFLAERFGASLCLIHAWDRPYYARERDVILGQGTDSPKPLSQLLKETAEEEMQRFIASLELPAGLTVTHRVCPGNVASAVIDAAKGFDLLVAGTHGRSGFKHLLLGSVAERLVRLSPTPVITVPPNTATRGA
ncbi:MAG: universal stress protein [Polyangiaceae bacterium]|nr:universal stress protein [Polyangiaceae bacterium]MCW5789370.1 universal stress protein [Polyangiaceae bacterium]